MSTLLEMREVDAGYGDAQVLWGVSLTIEEGDFVALVGANGAGKTTIMNTLSGLVRPMHGELLYKGKRINSLPAWSRVGMGVALMPEGRKLFAGLTTEQNLILGAFSRKDKEVGKDLASVMELFPEIDRRRNQLAGSLSGGEQQMVAIGRALMSKPSLLLVDELSLGLAPIVVDRLAAVLQRLHTETGLAVFIVEQDVHLALSMARMGYVLEAGHIRAHGEAKRLLESDEVRKAYLGV